MHQGWLYNEGTPCSGAYSSPTSYTSKIAMYTSSTHFSWDAFPAEQILACTKKMLSSTLEDSLDASAQVFEQA